MQRASYNTATIMCITVAGIVEALQQALKGAPDVTPRLPTFVLSPRWNFVPLGLLVIAFVMWVLGRRAVQRASPQQVGSQTATQAATAEASTTQVKNVDEFYRTYDNRMLAETEDFIRAESNKYPPDQRERFLTRLLASVITISLFERAWLTIFRSQLKTLHDLNVRIRTYEELRRSYDEAAKLHPQIHANGTFEMWLGYLKASVLVREYSPTQIEITVRGVEFLKYLVQMHYDESLRIG